MEIAIIVAVDELGGFGKNGKIPWNIAEDMEHFKKTTNDSVCVMGRRTYEDMINMRLGDKEVPDDFVLLPNRESFVVSSNENYSCSGATHIKNIRGVLEKYKNTNRKVFILGGSRMFIEALSHKPKIYMTIVKGQTYDCDVYFPVQLLINYKILSGTETEQCYFIEYIPA